VAARNDGRFGRTRPWQAKNIVVFIKNRHFCPSSFLTMEFHSHFINRASARCLRMQRAPSRFSGFDALWKAVETAFVIRAFFFPPG